MPRFEVFVPAAPPALPMNLTLRIEAEHWLAALKTGLTKIGGPQMTNNVLCDIMDDGSIHVTDSSSGRVFRIQEMAAPAEAPAASKEEPAVAPPPALSAKPVEGPVAAVPPAPAPPKAAKPPAPSPAPAAVKPVSVPPAKPVAPPQRAAPPPPAPRPPVQGLPAAKVPTPVARLRPSSESKSVEQVAQPSQPQPAKIGRTPRQAREDLLSELFDAVGKLEGQRDRKAGLAFLLDLAMEKLRCEAGSVFLASLGTDELSFEVVRGPRSAELASSQMKVHMGVGLVGFCAQENVCVAVSDAQKDRRFHKAISEAIGYETRSLLCAPIAREGRVLGALEVLNKSGTAFEEGDLAVLAYLSAQAAEFLLRLEMQPDRTR